MPMPILTFFLPMILLSGLLLPVALLGAPFYYLFQVITGQMNVGDITQFLQDMFGNLFSSTDWEEFMAMLRDMLPWLFGG